MKNKEFYLDEIIDLISHGCKVAVKDNAPSACQVSCECDECLFSSCSGVFSGVTEYLKCNQEKFKEWANEEYVKPKVDWEKVPVDTSVYVWNSEHGERARHFAKVEKGVIYTWINGLTSFTSNKDQVESWDYAELAEPNPEWMKKKGSK